MGTDSELFSLVYFSRSTVEPRKVDAEIRSILDSARKKNPEYEVTGALLFSRGFFAQVLEGSLTSVQSTLEKIRSDPRHTEISVLSCRPIAKRNFADWSMAYAEPDRDGTVSERINGILENASCIDCDDAGSEVLSVLQMLITGSETISSGT
ncbi:BLUF domain-containing protein [Occallatibacter savannae]|uniref:BLUF domain-containing protein n=1 Tax=Occallatibacter savannae TaxID=1002691 RepID=UPI000D68C679|nr:BLUF domain-containing protein [Occallatibacter savannae]